jgi:hypothetical protein
MLAHATKPLECALVMLALMDPLANDLLVPMVALDMALANQTKILPKIMLGPWQRVLILISGCLVALGVLDQHLSRARKIALATWNTWTTTFKHTWSVTLRPGTRVCTLAASVTLDTMVPTVLSASAQLVLTHLIVLAQSIFLPAHWTP